MEPKSFFTQVVDNFKMCVTKKYAEFNGRARRTEFWLFALAQFAIGLVLGIFGMMGQTASTIFTALSGLVSLALLVPSIAVAWRRLHDLGKGGGWIFLVLIPVIGQIWFVVLMCLPGEPGTNRFNK